MAKRRVIDEPLPDLSVPWSGTDAQGQYGYDKSRVEDLLKQQIGSKYSDFRTSPPDANNYIHLYFFVTEEDAASYDELKDDQPEEAYALVAKDLIIPINTAQADSFNSYLYTTMDPTADIVVSEASLDVSLRFCAVKISNGERQNLGSRGTLTIQNSLDNGVTWNTVATLDSVINSVDYDQTEIFFTFNLGQYLSKEYTQFLRVRASFKYTDEEDVERTAYSTWVQIANTITYTQLSLTCLQGWHTPLFRANIQQIGFPINYMVYGAVAKTLHIQIQGAAVNPLTIDYPLGVADNGVQIARDIKDALDTYRIFDHGVRTVTAWLECNDGLGGKIYSETLVNRFMVIDPATAAYPDRPYLMLQDVVTRVKNYVQTKICDYAVFNPIVVDESTITPGSAPIDVLFYLTNYSATFPSGSNLIEYYAFESLVTPGEKHSLVTTVELESSTIGDINTYFRVWRKDDNDQMINFMQQSMGDSSLDVVVDNSDSFSPTLGATFAINPKIRNNSERNPDTILNAQANNEVVPSEWHGFDFVNDGWVTAEDGTKVLRVLSGERLTILLNPFAQFLTTPDSSMTLEFDFAMRNVTNEDDPIISLFEQIAAGGVLNYRGVMFRPLEGNFYTKSNVIDSETNFRYCEEKRTHVSININNAVVPTVNGDGLYDPGSYTPAPSIALVRVFIDGNIEREMKFVVTDPNEFCTGEMSNGGIIIGQGGYTVLTSEPADWATRWTDYYTKSGNDYNPIGTAEAPTFAVGTYYRKVVAGADIDIYSIRLYANRQLDSQSIVKNWIATLPSAEEKLKQRTENDILTGGRVDVEKVKALGKRVLILHGDEPYFYRTSVSNVWWEIFQYDENGNYVPELSGTICRQTGMKPKRQGSTANTYYYSNIQTKIDDGGSITIPISQFHESITVSEPYQIDILDENDQVIGQKMVVDIYGGNLGKYDPVRNEPKQYDYENGMVTVPDGWIDGNNKYRGMGFMVAADTPLATKLVLKVNYASSMQSHLCGGTRLYSDLHTKVVGPNSLQQAVDPQGKGTCRVAKYTEPVYFFTQAEGSNDVVYRGGGNFGAGKMDKPTWGYVKKLHPMFTMIEGSDNNYPLTDMRVPFTTDPNCPEYVSYSVEDEGYFYNGLQCLDFDAGKTDDDEVPVTSIRDRIAEILNFVYMHSPSIEIFPGTYEQFIYSEYAQDTVKKYWCTEGDEAYRLKRYNYVLNRWEDAGLWDAENQVFEVIDLRTHEFTAETFTNSTHKTDYAYLNTEFIAAIVAHAKKYIGFYFKAESLRFHYAFQNHFMAGTDNCSKNTYYVLDPTAKTVTIDGETRQCYLLELHQDDVDTILITDNNGRSTKPYYIDRMHPFDDKDLNHTTSCYEGTNNMLFNLVEAMYEDTLELQSTLKAIFNAMVSLVTAADNAKGYTNSIWGCLQKYLFSIQEFYSVTAYNEQARIRYEWPALLGFVSQGSGARSIAPITQSMGSQKMAETQFMLRRVIYMASYAAWGNFYDAGKTYSVGIADATGTFSMQAFHLPNTSESNNNYSFDVVPHQYIYPTGMLGQTSIDPHVRVAPGQSFHLNLGDTSSNDTGLSVLGGNYYRSFGNVGDLSVSPNVTFNVQGKRLTEFVAEPTTTYVDSETGKTVGAFRPNQLNITAKGVKTVSLKNSGISGTHNAMELTRLVSLDLRGTYIYNVSIPASENLTAIYLPASIVSLSLRNLPSLTTFAIDGYGSLETLYIDNTIDPEVSAQIVNELYAAQDKVITSLSVYGVDWGNVSSAMLEWFVSIPVCDITGRVSVRSGDILSFNAVVTLIERYGDIHSASNVLQVIYDKSPITSIVVNGDKYVKQKGLWNGWSISVRPSTGNDVAVVDGHADISWALSGASLSQYAEVVDPVKGIVNVKKVDITKNPVGFQLHVEVGQTENPRISYNKTVGFAQRVPSVGDFAYADGTFDNEWDTSKELVGTVVKIDVMEWYDAQTPSKCTCWVYAKENVKLYSTNGVISNMQSMAWGPYTESAGTNGFPSAYLNEVAGYAEVGSIADLPMGNITSSGIPDGNGGFDYRYIGDTFLDDNEDDGYYKVTGGAAKDFATVTKADQMKDLANSIIDGYMIDHLHELSKRPTTSTELADAMRAMADWATSQSYSAVTRYYQLFFPAAYACHVYQPSGINEANLHDSYKKGNWRLPSAGLLARIYNFFYNSCGRIRYGNGGRVSVDHADERPTLLEARLPLFANLLARYNASGSTVGFPFEMPTGNTYHWSCTEYGSTYAWYVYFTYGNFTNGYGKYLARIVRGVAAFDFEIESEPEEEAA